MIVVRIPCRSGGGGYPEALNGAALTSGRWARLVTDRGGWLPDASPAPSPDARSASRCSHGHPLEPTRYAAYPMCLLAVAAASGETWYPSLEWPASDSGDHQDPPGLSPGEIRDAILSNPGRVGDEGRDFMTKVRATAIARELRWRRQGVPRIRITSMACTQVLVTPGVDAVAASEMLELRMQRVRDEMASLARVIEVGGAGDWVAEALTVKRDSESDILRVSSSSTKNPSPRQRPHP